MARPRRRDATQSIPKKDGISFGGTEYIIPPNSGNSPGTIYTEISHKNAGGQGPSLEPNRKDTGQLLFFPESKWTGSDPIPNVSAVSRRGDYSMDNDEIFKCYIDQNNRDQTQLREDIRESERRISNSINEIEERTESRIGRIETRMDERLNRIEDLISNQNTKIDRMGDKVDNAKNWVIGIAITVILSIGALTIALLRFISKS